MRIPNSIMNLDAKRDWGYAGNYVIAMWQMRMSGVCPEDKHKFITGMG